MKNELVIFDVCNTLFDSNTTFDFIRFALKEKRPNKQFLFKALTKRLSPFFIAGILLGKALGKDLVRNLSVSLLKGLRKEELLALAEDFYNKHLQTRRITDVIQILEDSRMGHEIWLFSNSIDPVIQTIAMHLGLQFEASELEYNQQGIFTGRIKRDLSGKKQEAFLKRFGKEARIKMMCSDNKSDLEILKLAQKPIVVIYKPSDKRFWQTLNPTFIEKF
jgi:HAD superfamily phosphoserine phosphatase-like hydrolase